MVAEDPRTHLRTGCSREGAYSIHGRIELSMPARRPCPMIRTSVRARE
jgi:hypothetical protein